MGKNHIKRITMPVTWTTQLKKGVTWVARAHPGAHSMEEGLPLVLVLRELLKYANTAREAKQILNHKNILIDGIRRKDHRFNVGLMDVISIPDLKEQYRVSLNQYKKLILIKIDEKEASSKICKIKGKGLWNGKTQLRLSDGRIIIVSKDTYKTSDSVIISVPDQKITGHLAFEKGAVVLLVKGKKTGTIGTIENIKNNVVTIKAEKEQLETPKSYCFVVGKQKPALTIN